MKRHIIVFYSTPTVPPVDVFVFCFLLFCFLFFFFSLLIVSKKGNTLLQLTGFEYLITFLLRRLPTISVDFRLPNFSDDFRPFPMTSDFRTIVPQRNQSEGSQTIHLICMTVGTKLTPNAAIVKLTANCLRSV